MTSNLDVRFKTVTRTLWAAATAITLSMGPAAAYAAGAAEISRDAQAALQSLYAKVRRPRRSARRRGRFSYSRRSRRPGWALAANLARVR